jgi:hypothetical protein
MAVYHSDSSGKVTIGIFAEKFSNQQHYFEKKVYVDKDMIAVGGGAKTWNGDPEYSPKIGAFLTSSRPEPENMSYWEVSSKDHLIAYSIGLKINIDGPDGEPMDRKKLINEYITWTKQSYPGTSQYPYIDAGIPEDHVLISGGFHVDWKLKPNDAGNLATASFPNSTYSWYARSKDHGVISPAGLHVWAIGIKEKIPDVSRVKGIICSEESYFAESHPHSTVTLKGGYAMTGGGANVHYDGPGNLLWNLTKKR